MSDISEPLHKDDNIKDLADNINHLSEISQNSRTTFFMLVLASAYSFLTIASTTDAALLSNSNTTSLPIINVNVSIKWFYIFSPFILSTIFVYFHLYLHRFWRSIVLLPLRHPDGRGVDNYVYPWLISSAFIRGEIPQLYKHRLSIKLETTLCLILAWGLIPIVLVFYWSRYLSAHNWMVTALHLTLITATSGFSLVHYLSAKNALRCMAANKEHERLQNIPDKKIRLTFGQINISILVVTIIFTTLWYLSASAINGVHLHRCIQSGQHNGCGNYHLGSSVLHAFQVNPFIEVADYRFVDKHDNWQAFLNAPDEMRLYLDNHPGLDLIDRNLKMMNGIGMFLPGSHIDSVVFDYAKLQHSVMTGSNLDNLSFVETNLIDADLQHTTIQNSQFVNVIADAARFSHSRFRSSNDSKVSINGVFNSASFENAKGGYVDFTGAGMVGTNFSGASFQFSLFESVDFSGARFDKSTLTHNVFRNTEFTNSTMTKSANFSFSEFINCTFYSPNINDSIFDNVDFRNTRFGFINDNTASNQWDPMIFNSRERVIKFSGLSAKFTDNSQLNNVVFEEAQLRSATFDSVSFFNAAFMNSDLSNAVFRNVSLESVEFNDVELLSTEFTDVKLNGVVFNDVDLTDADLTLTSGLTQELLANACGDSSTLLPEGLKVKPCQREWIQ